MRFSFAVGGVLAALLPVTASAIVNMKSSGYSESWADVNVPGIGYDLRVERTYNSRSLFNGLFGFGWCSDYETTIDVTPEGNLRLTECGAGMEIVYLPKNFNAGKVDVTIKAIMEDVKKRRPDLKPDYLADLEKELKINDFMREEFGRRMNIKGKVQDGTVYLANGRETETITLKNGVYKRVLTDGTFQLFDAAIGHLSHMYDKNQNFLKLTWEKGTLQQVIDNQGRKLTFKYNPSTKKVAEIVGPDGLKAVYSMKGDNLTNVTDAKGHKYVYTYDEVHNLTRVDYPDKTYKSLSYNKDKDWVVSFRNRKGCTEAYDYQVAPDDPLNHFWSNVVKKCSGKITNQSKYEFFHRPRPDGTGVYLYRVRTENNGNVTDIVYHEIFGKPISVVRDNLKTDYSYYENGLIKTKKESGKMLTFEYKNPCGKVSQLTTQTVDEARKPTQVKDKNKISKTHFSYDGKKCNLVTAENTEGQKLKLEYDPQGRIAQIEDQSKKLVKIQYENKFGKPSIVTRPGLGTIQVIYKPDGEIQKVESKEGPNVATQVASVFNNMLEIIAPATSEAPL